MKKLSVSLLAAFIVATPVALVPTQAQAAGPCKVNGFTIHARLQMSVRGISENEVRESVRVNCSYGKFQANKGAWIYEGNSKHPVVIMFNDGNVHTSYWRTPGGGGGVGSWNVKPSAK